MFAGEGLRTLVVANKTFEPREFYEWLRRYDAAWLVTPWLYPLTEASTNFWDHFSQNPDLKEEIEDLEEELEAGMTLLGATAIEDKLQDHVADTIEFIHQAHIKLWVLTGDKLETAMNIGCCYVYVSESTVIILIMLWLIKIMGWGRIDFDEKNG